MGIICPQYVFLQSIVVYKRYDILYCIVKVKLQHIMLYQTYKYYLPKVRVFAINSGIQRYDILCCIAKVKLQHVMLYQTYKYYLPKVLAFAINSGIQRYDILYCKS